MIKAILTMALLTTAILTTAGAEPDAPVIMVKGLKDDTDEGKILDAFTPMAHVKEIRLARERGSKVGST